MKSVLIRKGEIKDLEEISHLLQAQLIEHRVEVDLDQLYEAAKGIIQNPERGFFWVAQIDSNVVGVAYLSFVWTLEHKGRSAWLEELYVKPELRKEGVGTLLLNAIFSELKNTNCSAIDLEIDIEHERVRSLYERHGFISLPRSRLVKILP